MQRVCLRYEDIDAPSIEVNSDLTLAEGEPATITTADLSASDLDEGPSTLTYTVTDGPTQETLLVGGSSASNFTQADLQAGTFVYNHTVSSTGAASFTFDLSDGVGPGPEGQTFEITPEPPMHQSTISGSVGTGNDTGWRLLASPSSAVRDNLEDDLEFDINSRTLLHTWDGTQWTPATTSSTPLPRGNGYILYFFDDSDTPITSDRLPLDVPDEGENQSEDVTVDGLNQNNCRAKN